MTPEIKRHAVLVSLLLKYSDLGMASSRKLTGEQEERQTIQCGRHAVIYGGVHLVCEDHDQRGLQEQFYRIHEVLSRGCGRILNLLTKLTLPKSG